MNLIEVGAIASSLIAIVTLITKLFNLITSIHKLIERLDVLQVKINHHEEIHAQLVQILKEHERRIMRLEQMEKRGVLRVA